MAEVEAGKGSPAAVPQNVCDGSLTDVLCVRDASTAKDKPTATKTSSVSQPKANTGDKPYMCGEYGYSTTQRSNLSRHKRTYTRQNPYKCD
ncbi:zinc finger protein 676-like [Branchiostoma floridae]|uniref:Zinc finger protein 676-like n=1 Tax=Branchiostoma floridae TaxID=7739 RepID=A0A9J7MY26_BRAFL|nr:zinc finger protein 676-like [Branchiostoma floridae]